MRRRVRNTPHFETPEDMMRAVNVYFETAEEAEEPYTLTGLCLHIGMSRAEFVNRKFDPKFADVMRQARLIIEHQHERNLLVSKHTAGTQFALKNLGWSDSARLDVGINGGGDPDNPESLKWTIEVVAPKAIDKKPKALTKEPTTEELFG